MYGMHFHCVEDLNMNKQPQTSVIRAMVPYMSRTSQWNKFEPSGKERSGKIEQQTYHPSSQFRSRIGINKLEQLTTKTYDKVHITSPSQKIKKE